MTGTSAGAAGPVRAQPLPDGLGDRLTDVRARIATAAATAGRSGDDVEIVVAVKYLDADAFAALAAAGLTAIGENRADAVLARHDAARAAGLAVDFIGPVQSRKARDLAAPGLVRTFHAVERLSAVRRLDEFTPDGAVCDLLVEVNVEGDEAKSGIVPGHLDRFLAECAAFSRVRVSGLMTMPPLPASPTGADARRPFAALRALAATEAARHDLGPALSMGTSGDYEAAVAEGATVVRLGRGLLFGAQGS